MTCQVNMDTFAYFFFGRLGHHRFIPLDSRLFERGCLKCGTPNPENCQFFPDKNMAQLVAQLGRRMKRSCIHRRTGMCCNGRVRLKNSIVSQFGSFFFFCLINSLLIVWITNFHYFNIFCWFSELSSFLLTEFNSTFPPTSPTFDCRFLEEQEDSQAQEVHEAWGLVHGDIMANTTYDMMVLWQCNVTIITVL